MKLVFIYNAKSDKLSKVLDFAHKIVSPNTYTCDLCSLTHGNFGELEEWEKFKSLTKINMEFYYKNNHPARYNNIEYPLVIAECGDSWSMLLTKNDLKEISGVTDLINRIKKELSTS